MGGEQAMTDPTLLRRAIESVGIEKPSDYTLVLEELERLMDEAKLKSVAAAIAEEVRVSVERLLPVLLDEDNDAHEKTDAEWDRMEEAAASTHRRDDDDDTIYSGAEEVETLMDERLVEKVARSLAAAFPNGSDTLHYLYESAAGEYNELAKVAIDASGLPALIRAATDLVKEAEEMGFGKTSEKALPGSWDALVQALTLIGTEPPSKG
jgi:hypothetical protein|uniref:Uncharacterized protein n=1 Tax=viral metagenome TaxID=1070528 RepID=A0A6H1Z9Y5_9ZZZZ